MNVQIWHCIIRILIDGIQFKKKCLILLETTQFATVLRLPLNATGGIGKNISAGKYNSGFNLIIPLTAQILRPREQQVIGQGIQFVQGKEKGEFPTDWKYCGCHNKLKLWEDPTIYSLLQNGLRPPVPGKVKVWKGERWERAGGQDEGSPSLRWHHAAHSPRCAQHSLRPTFQHGDTAGLHHHLFTLQGKVGVHHVKH